MNKTLFVKAIIGKVTLLIFFLTLLYLFRYHLSLINLDIQMRYREGAIIDHFQMLAKRQSPHTFITNVDHLNVYGLVYIQLVAVISKITNLTYSLKLYKVVTAIFIWGYMGILLHYYRKKLRLNWIYSLGLLTIAYTFMLFGTAPLVGQDSLGVFLYVGCFMIPIVFNYSKKSLIISALLGILALYVKIYFVVATIFVFLALLFKRDLRKCFFYISIITIVGVTSILYIFRYHPTYFFDVGLVPYLAASYNFDHTVFQLKDFFLNYAWLLLVLGGFNLWVLKNKKKVLLNELLLFLMFSLVIFVAVLGGNTGTHIMYLVQLVVPIFLLLLGFILKEAEIKLELLNTLLLIAITRGLVLQLPQRIITTSNNLLGNWSTVEREILSANNVLMASPAVGNFAVKHNLDFVDTGQNEYIEAIQDENELKIFGKVFFKKELEKIIIAKQNHKNKVDADILAGTYDLVLVPSYDSWTIDASSLKSNYFMEKTVPLYFPHSEQTHEVIYWRIK